MCPKLRVISMSADVGVGVRTLTDLLYNKMHVLLLILWAL